MSLLSFPYLSCAEKKKPFTGKSNQRACPRSHRSATCRPITRSPSETSSSWRKRPSDWLPNCRTPNFTWRASRAATTTWRRSRGSKFTHGARARSCHVCVSILARNLLRMTVYPLLGMHAVLKTEAESTLHAAQHNLNDVITSWTCAQGKCVCAGSTVSWAQPRRRCRERGAWGRNWPERKTCWPETLSASGSSWRFVTALSELCHKTWDVMLLLISPFLEVGSQAQFETTCLCF